MPTRKLTPPPARKNRTVLVAVTGFSPAVLTETVWALAQENPPVIPDEIIAITTAKGRAEIAKQLFGEDKIWAQLRKHILKRADDPRLDFSDKSRHVKVFALQKNGDTEYLDDVSTIEQHNAAADTIVRELWAVAGPDGTNLIASISGGFKSMSALMFAGVSLVGRSGTRVLHIHVEAPYDDGRLTPRFYFPEQAAQDLYMPGNSKPFKAKAAAKKLRLGEMDIVPLRELFARELGSTPPGSYRELIALAKHGVKQATEMMAKVTKLVLSKTQARIQVNGEVVDFGNAKTQYLVLYFFATYAKYKDEKPAWLTDERLSGFETVSRQIQKWATMELKTVFWQTPKSTVNSWKDGWLTKRLSDVKKLLDKHPASRPLVALLPSRDERELVLPADAIEFMDTL